MRHLVVWMLGALSLGAVAAEDPFAVLTAHLRAGQCEKGTPGADAWFTGDLHIAEDGSLKGTEKLLLVPNRKWADQGVEACEIRWNLTGQLAGTGACTTCDMAVSVVAKADIEASTCPQELLTGRKSPYNGVRVGGEAPDFTQHYDVALDGEGRATVSFASSGREVGKGLYVGGRLGWVSGHQCKFW